MSNHTCHRPGLVSETPTHRPGLVSEETAPATLMEMGATLTDSHQLVPGLWSLVGLGWCGHAGWVTLLFQDRNSFFS